MRKFFVFWLIRMACFAYRELKESIEEGLTFSIAGEEIYIHYDQQREEFTFRMRKLPKPAPITKPTPKPAPRRK